MPIMLLTRLRIGRRGSEWRWRNRDKNDDEQCSMCGVGVLDDGWKRHAREFLATKNNDSATTVWRRVS